MYDNIPSSMGALRIARDCFQKTGKQIAIFWNKDMNSYFIRIMNEIIHSFIHIEDGYLKYGSNAVVAGYVDSELDYTRLYAINSIVKSYADYMDIREGKLFFEEAV